MRLPSDARPAPQSTIVKKIALASHMETEGNEKESYDIKLKKRAYYFNILFMRSKAKSVFSLIS